MHINVSQTVLIPAKLAPLTEKVSPCGRYVNNCVGFHCNAPDCVSVTARMRERLVVSRSAIFTAEDVKIRTYLHQKRLNSSTVRRMLRRFHPTEFST